MLRLDVADDLPDGREHLGGEAHRQNGAGQDAQGRQTERHQPDMLHILQKQLLIVEGLVLQAAFRRPGDPPGVGPAAQSHLGGLPGSVPGGELGPGFPGP